MSTVDLIIKIPEEKYNYIKKQVAVGIDNPLKVYIANGTPLPKGHGRLIDADAYIEKHEEYGWLDDITVDIFNKITPTIIPATSEDYNCIVCAHDGDSNICLECENGSNYFKVRNPEMYKI